MRCCCAAAAAAADAVAVSVGACCGKWTQREHKQPTYSACACTENKIKFMLVK